MAGVLSIGNMYPPDSEGGYELAWQSNVRWLRERGHSVRVLTSDLRLGGRVGTEDPDVHRDLRWYWRDHGFPPVGRLERLRRERHNAGVLRRHLQDLKPDVVAWWGMGGMSLSLIEQVQRAGIPAVGHVGDDWMLYGPEVDAWTRACRGRPRLGSLIGTLAGVPSGLDLGAAACWHFVSRHTRARALAAGWSLPRTVITPAGVDSGLFRPSPPEEWRWRLLYAGRIDPRKGIDTVLHALARLPAEATLEIVGRGDPRHETELRQLAERLGLAERVRWSGAFPREQMPERFAAADVVVFPVRWEEPWGLVPLEAMAVGRPVLATGTGGSGEYLRHEQNCLTFSPDDQQALAASLVRLASEPPLRERLRKGGAETAAVYTDEAFNESLRRSIEEVLPSA